MELEHDSQTASFQSEDVLEDELNSGELEPYSSPDRTDPEDNCYNEPTTSISLSLKPPDELTWQVVMATFFATFGCLNFGYALGWTAQSLDYIQDDPDMPNFTDTQNSWVSSILTIGAILGTFIGADLSDRLGRQQTLIATAVVAIVGWIMVSLSNSFALIAVARFVLGMSIGLVNTASPPYIAEITPSTYRGATGGQFQNGVNGGIFISLLISPYLPWRTLSVIGLVFGCIMGIGLMFMHESPVWLLSTGQLERYEKSSRFFAGKTHVLYPEFAPPTSESQSLPPKESLLERWKKLLKNPQMYKPLCLCVFMAGAFQLSAITVITFYNVTIFSNAGLSDDDANLSSQLLGAFQLAVGIAGSILSTKWSRKPHFLVTSYLTSCGLFSIAISFLVKNNYYDANVMNYVVIAAFVFTISIFAFGAGTITWAYVGELLPADGTGFVVGAASFTNWFVSFFLAFYYSPMQKLMGDDGVFFFYGALHFTCTCCLVWLPETKGMSLSEIQSSFKSRKRRMRPKLFRRRRNNNPYSQMENDD